jgi:hypothetical protein
MKVPSGCCGGLFVFIKYVVVHAGKAAHSRKRKKNKGGILWGG